MKVIHEKKAVPARRDLPRPGRFRLFVGFLLALLGGLAVAYYPEPFMTNVEAVMTKYYELQQGGLQSASMAEPPSATTAIAKANAFRNEYGTYMRWTPQVVGVLCLLFAGWCLKKRIGYFLAASAAVAITIGALAAAYDWFIPPHCIAMPAVGLAYLIEAGPKPAGITIRGVLGFGFVLVALVGLVLGFFFLPRWGGSGEVIAKSIQNHGPSYLWSEPAEATSVWMLSARFVDQWKDVVMWGAALLAASIGAVLCKDKLLRFLSACMITTVAVLLFKSAYVHWHYFPTLGENIAPQPQWSLGNIELWQWLALAELVIVTAVLVYKSIGAGGLTVAVALLWLCCGLHVDTYAGRLVSVRVLSPVAAQKLSSTTSPTMSAELHKRASSNHGPSGGLIFGGNRAQLTSADIAGAAAPLGWFYLTCFLIGIITAGGLRMLIRSRDARTWVMCGLWLLFAVLAAYVYWHWPRAKYADSAEWLVTTLTSHPIHRMLALALAAGGAAFFGTWSLRWNSRYHTWLYAAATAIFISTVLSFVALAVMIRWGGFPALPVVTYIVLAVGQSALMWVLLLHANFVKPENAAAETNARQPRTA